MNRENLAVGGTFNDRIVSTSGNDAGSVASRKHNHFRMEESCISMAGLHKTLLMQSSQSTRTNRTYVHCVGVPFPTVREYHYATDKAYNAVMGNMIRFLDRGLKNVVDVITGEANSACNQLSKNRLVHQQSPERSNEPSSNHYRSCSFKGIYIGSFGQTRY